MATNEERLRQLEIYESRIRKELDRRELSEIRQQMLERIISYQGPVRIVTEALWDDLVSKDYLTAEQRERYRLVYDYCVAFSELRALKHQFNLTAKSQGYNGAVKWKAKEYVPIVLTTIGFVADSSTVIPLIQNKIKRFFAPDPLRQYISDYAFICLLNDLLDADRSRYQQIEDQLSTLAKNSPRRAQILEYLKPSITKMKSIIPFIREEGRKEVYAVLPDTDTG
jgi:hypothetical protein